MSRTRSFPCDPESKLTVFMWQAIEQVGKEVREVIWRTVDPESATICRVPTGCSKPLEEDPAIEDDVPMMHSGGRLRMASISEMSRPQFLTDGVPPTRIDESVETEDEHEDVEKKEDLALDRRPTGAQFVGLQEKENPLG